MHWYGNSLQPDVSDSDNDSCPGRKVNESVPTILLDRNPKQFLTYQPLPITNIVFIAINLYTSILIVNFKAFFI